MDCIAKFHIFSINVTLFLNLITLFELFLMFDFSRKISIVKQKVEDIDRNVDIFYDIFCQSYHK